MGPQVRDPGETTGIASVVDALAGALAALDDGLASARAVRDQTFAVARTTVEGRDIAALLEAELRPARARLDAVLVELSAHRRMIAGAHRAAVALEQREIHDFRRDLEILRARMAPYRRLDRVSAWPMAPEARRPGVPEFGRPVGSPAAEDARWAGIGEERDRQPAPANPFAFLLRGRSSAVHAQATGPQGSSQAFDVEADDAGGPLADPVAMPAPIDDPGRDGEPAGDGTPVGGQAPDEDATVVGIADAGAEAVTDADDASDDADDAADDADDAADDDIRGGPTAPADAGISLVAKADGATADAAEDADASEDAAAAAAAAWHAADLASAAEERRLQDRSRRRIRHRAGTIPALVLMLLAVNTHGASLEAGTVAGSSRAAAETPQPTLEVAGDAATEPGDDTTTGDPAGQPALSLTSTTITGAGAPANRRPDAVPSDRSSLLDSTSTSIVAHVIYRVSTTRPLIALTFDDGYNPTALRQIVSILEQEHVAATFFVNGMYLTRAPDVWRQIAADGFAVGNHTYHHTDVRTLTDSQIAADLARTESAWQALTGSPLAPLFRPPYGAHTAATDLEVASAGYPTIVLWNVTAGDTARNPSRSQLIANATRGTDGSIVLMHAGPAITPYVLPDIIAWYRAHGYSFVTVPQLIAAAGS